MIWDLHCHLHGVEGRTPHERIARIIEYADRMGVAKMIFFMGMSFLRDPTPDELRLQNDEVLEAISHWHDRCYGFVYLNPNYLEASLDELTRCVADGPMVGVKLWVAQRCDAAAVDTIVERATELDAVIYQHTWLKAGGNLTGESTPQELVTLALRHPAAKLICGHSGGDWELGIRAVRRAGHVAIGIGGSDPTAGMLEMAVRELGAERIVFGSDVGGRSFASQLAKVQGAELTDADKELILGGNLRRWLRPILEIKGLPLD